jgi:hypothetical protein
MFWETSCNPTDSRLTVILSHASALIHRGAGLGVCWERSSTEPPFRKKAHSSPLTCSWAHQGMIIDGNS